MAGDTNYTLYYNVLDYFKTIMKNHPSINFVSQGDVFSVDTKEFPQYPLGNVLITNATFDGKSTDYAVQLIVADKTKLKGNESSGSFNELTNTFEGVDDTVDVHANTLSILNDLVSWTERKEEGFEITSTIGCTAFKERFDNGLAGWTADFTLRVHNDRNICLFDLSPIVTTAYKVENCITGTPFYVTFSESVPDGKNTFYSDDLEGSYAGYKIIDTYDTSEVELDFENLTPRLVTTPQSPVGWIPTPAPDIAERWFVDCGAFENFTYQGSSGTDWSITFILSDGSIVTYTDLTYTDTCKIGILDSTGSPSLSFGISC